MSNALTVIEQKQVPFYADQITAVLVQADDGARVIYVPVRPICDLLGIAWQSQLRRITQDEVLSEESRGVTVTVTPQGRAQRQEMICLPLDYINGWLFGISAKRVKPAVKEQLIRYKQECYKVLSKAFQSGQLSLDGRYAELLNNTDSPAVQAYKTIEALLDMARQQVLLEAAVTDHEQRLQSLEAWRGDEGRMVTPSQASDLSQAVKAVAHELGKQSGRNEYGGVYGEMYRRFSINSYKRLPSAEFDAAMDWLRQWFESLTDDSAPF